MNMDIRHSRLRPALVLALACCALAVSAIVASGAQAAQWYAGSTETGTAVLASPAPLTAGLEETHFATGYLKGQTASALEFNYVTSGVQVQVTATGVEVLQSGTPSTIFNKSGSASGNVRLLLKNVTLSGLGSACIVKGGQIQTKELTVSPVTVGGKSYLKILPSGGSFFTLNITEGSRQCSLSGSYNLTGSLYAAAGDIGSAKVSHSVVFSPAIETEAGGSIALEGIPAWFEGGLSTSLTGSSSGQYWQAK